MSTVREKLVAVFYVLSVNKVTFIVIGRENAFVASATQFITMFVSVR